MFWYTLLYGLSYCWVWKIYCVDRLAVCTFSRPNPCPRICRIFWTLLIREQSWSLLAQVHTWLLIFKGTLAQDFPVSATKEYSRSFFVSGTCSILKRLFARLYNKNCTTFLHGSHREQSLGWFFLCRSIQKDDRGFRHLTETFVETYDLTWHTLKDRKTQFMRSKPSPETLPFQPSSRVQWPRRSDRYSWRHSRLWTCPSSGNGIPRYCHREEKG